MVVLPVVSGQILLLRHFRHATRSWHLEVPRGFGEAGMSSEQNARRELAEEVGAECGRLLPLGPRHCNTGMDGDRVELFYAELLAAGRPDAEEGIESVRAFPVAEVERLICAGEITDAFTIAAFARARLRGLI